MIAHRVGLQVVHSFGLGRSVSVGLQVLGREVEPAVAWLAVPQSASSYSSAPFSNRA